MANAPSTSPAVMAKPVASSPVVATLPTTVPLAAVSDTLKLWPAVMAVPLSVTLTVASSVTGVVPSVAWIVSV